jgi:glutathione S-transferase
MFIQLVFIPEPKRDLMLIEKSRALLPPLLEILDRHLASREYLVGERFTLGDLNASSVVNLTAAVQYDVSGYAALGRWLARVKDRPAFQRFSAIEP